MKPNEVTAIGAPGSLARFKAEHPQDWHRLLGAGEGYEALDRYVYGSNPTHHLPEWEGTSTLDEPPSHYASAWELGERIVSGRTEYLYATIVRWHGVPTIEQFYDFKPLDPIRYALGEAPGSGPIKA